MHIEILILPLKSWTYFQNMKIVFQSQPWFQTTIALQAKKRLFHYHPSNAVVHFQWFNHRAFCNILLLKLIGNPINGYLINGSEAYFQSSCLCPGIFSFWTDPVVECHGQCPGMPFPHLGHFCCGNATLVKLVWYEIERKLRYLVIAVTEEQTMSCLR